MYKSTKAQVSSSIRYLLFKGFRVTQNRLGSFFIADLVLFWIKPGTWYYLLSYDKSISDLLKIRVLLESEKEVDTQTLLSLLDHINILSID